MHTTVCLEQNISVKLQFNNTVLAMSSMINLLNAEMITFQTGKNVHIDFLK